MIPHWGSLHDLIVIIIIMYALKYFNMFSFVIILQIVLGFYLFNIFLTYFSTLS